MVEQISIRLILASVVDIQTAYNVMTGLHISIVGVAN